MGPLWLDGTGSCAQSPVAIGGGTARLMRGVTAMRNSFLLCVMFAGACTAHGSARVNAEATTPNLVYVSDDVQVIEDYDEPVFFSGNFYWRWDNGVWYQSRYHTRGWVRVSSPPPQIVRIERPQAYVHYRAGAQTTVRQDPGPTHQEIKQEEKAARQEDKAVRQEEKREMKEEKREIKQEAKEDKREMKEDKREMKEDKKEAKEDKKEAKEDKKEAKEDKKDAKEGKKGKK
jgi:hypothetical protein